MKEIPHADRLPGGPTGRNRQRVETLLFCLAEIALCLFAAVFMVKRVQHGIDFSDEGWYIADPVLVAKGRIPYVNVLDVVPGLTIPLALVFRAYLAVAGTEGIFMFSRYLYLVWAFGVLALTLFVIRRHLLPDFPVIAGLPVLLMLYYLFDINYNTVGIYYLPLLIALVCAAWDMPEQKAFRFGIAAGVLGARAIIASPFLLIPALCIILLLLIRRKKKQLLGILLGAGIAALLVIGWCCLRGGPERLIYGLFAILKDDDYFHYERRISLSKTLYMIWRYTVPALRFAASALLARLLLRRRERLLRAVLCALALGFMLYGIYTGLRWQRLMIINCWFEFIILPLLPGRGKRKADLALCGVVVLYYLMFVTSSIFNIFGYEGREYWLVVPCILSCLALYLAIPQRFAARSVFTVLIAGFFLIQCRYSWDQIYRDAPIPEHTATVSSGIWKGCKTTEARARAVVELEDCIHEITEPGDRVLFREWVSYAYVMNDGDACTPSPLVSCDARCNTPVFLFDLFYTDRAVPTKIIYISEEGSSLSIETEDCAFNPFVNAYYEKTFTYENELFRVLEYDLRHENEALACAMENASKLSRQS
ncbi:MAG: hypothetical protein K6F56_11040 [Oscillospiraceae bacterium]|nr:hypothetical protein [Oscillospiraceae bacterium]